jgi:Zn-dependent M28 family amino/carboxypeptidase
VTPTAFSKPALVRRYQQTITSEALASRLYFLASDFFEGRETTARGQKLAAQYLASQYRLLGLAPKGSVKTTDPLSPSAYFQPFPVYKRVAKETHLEVMVNGSPVASSTFSPETQDGLSYFLSGNISKASGGVVFAGYGIADDKLGYNDYAALAKRGISIDGKWVLILEDEPLADAATSLLSTPERKPSSWSTQFINKKRALWNAGKARGVLVVKDASPRMQGAFADAAALTALNAQKTGNFRLNQSSPFPPTYAISTRLANQILSSSGHTIEDLRREINQSLRPTVFDVSGVTVNTSAEPFKELETENVLAFIEGSDPLLKDEVVVISAHYDHLGVNQGLKGDQIFNGAADDGSGVAASLELAQAFMRAKRDGFGPRRSILFINFSGEEKGLLGSFYYAHKEPLIPLEKTVANINMDGVGGIDLKHPTRSRNYIYINGAKNLSDELIDINKRIKTVTGSTIELTDGPGFYSDDKNFQAQLIPFIYYSTGLTEHYHAPGDEPNTIDYDHLARVTQLIFGTAWQVANQDARPRSVNRSQLTLLGYSCPTCPFECDTAVYDHPGECPVCEMNLTPKYSYQADSGVRASHR